MEKRRLSALATFREKVGEMEAKGMKAGKPGEFAAAVARGRAEEARAPR